MTKGEATNADLLLNRVQELMRQEQWQNAIHVLHQHEAAVDADPRLSWGRGWAHYKLGEYEQAVHSLRRAVELEPTMHTALWALGVTLEEAGRLEEAELQLLRAIVLRDGSLPRLDLANLYFAQGRKLEAEQVQREGARLRPTARERIEALANILDDLGKDTEAASLRKNAEELPTREERRAHAGKTDDST